jgi:hypothetical protein
MSQRRQLPTDLRIVVDLSATALGCQDEELVKMSETVDGVLAPSLIATLGNRRIEVGNHHDPHLRAELILRPAVPGTADEVSGNTTP